MNDQLTPDQLVALYKTMLQQAHLEQEARWARARLYLILMTAGFAGTLALLKMEGPWYVDTIIAAAFLAQGMCGIVFSASLARKEHDFTKSERLRSLESRLGLTQEGDAAPDRRASVSPAVTALILLSILHFGACGLTFWLTFFVPPELPTDEEAIVQFAPSAVARSCSGSDL